MAAVALDSRAEERMYLSKVKEVLTSRRSASFCNNGPVQLLDHLFLGNRDDARDPKTLRRCKITHVLNCAAVKDYSKELVDNPYPPETGVISYQEFEGRDNDGYPILMHFPKSKEFIDDAKRKCGRVMVHCEMGVNRSGAICVAYLMVKEGMTLLQALRMIKIERPVLLVNEGFQRQLVQFGMEKGLM